MRIAFDHQIFTQQRFGGVSRYFAELAPQLKRLGECPRIFAGLHQNEYLRTVDAEVIRGRFTPELPRRLHRLRIMANETYAMRAIARWKPDLVHETYFRNHSCAPRGTPTVFTFHDMIHELFPAQFPGRSSETSIKRETIELADHVICVSEHTRNDLIRLFLVDPAKVSVVHHGFMQSTTEGSGMSFGSRPYFLFVGHRGGYKNFDRLLQAGADSGIQRDFDLIAFGGEPFSLLETERIAAYGYRKDQVRHTRGSDGLLADLYRGAHALVYPSIYEGFGLPPLEAMARDCPVISSNSSSMPEVIGDAAEFFAPLEVEDMARALAHVAESDTRRRDLVAKGRERIKLFSWEATALKTREIYKNLLR